MSFQEYFKNIRVEIAGFHTDAYKRNTLLDSSDLILYLLASQNEMESLKCKKIKIGQNSFQFDFDRFRLVDKYRSKRINIIFKQASPEKDRKASVTTKVIRKLLSRCQKDKLGIEEVVDNVEYLSLPDANIELLSLITNALEINQRFGSRSIRSLMSSLSTKFIFYRVHRSLKAHLRAFHLRKRFHEGSYELKSLNESQIVEPIIYVATCEQNLDLQMPSMS